MEKITDLSNYRNKKVIMDEADKLIDYIFEQAKQGTAIHKVEQDIFSKLLTMGHQALGQFIVLQGDGEQVNKVLDRILQFEQPVDSIERMAYQGAETVEDFRNSLPKIKPDEEHDIIVTTADGKGRTRDHKSY